MDGHDVPPKLRATPTEARSVPTDPGRALSGVMVVGAVGAIVSPVVVGGLVEPLGLPVLLLATGLLCGVTAVGLRFRSR